MKVNNKKLRPMETLTIAFYVCRRALKILFDFPVFLIPFFIAIAINLVIGYFGIHHFIELYNVWVPPENKEYEELAFVFEHTLDIFIYLALFGFVQAILCSLVLEMVEHLKHQKQPSFWVALGDTFRLNFISLIPVVVIGSIISLIFMYIKIIISIFTGGRDNNRSFSEKIIGAVLDGIIRFIERMFEVTFLLSYPAIAWDNKNGFQALGYAYKITKSSFGSIVGQIVILPVINFITFLPFIILVVIFSMVNIFNIFTIGVLLVVFLFSMTFYGFVEILYCAEIYTWFRNAEKISNEQRISDSGAMQRAQKPNIIGVVKSIY